MDQPNPQEKLSVIEGRMQDLRLQHYTLGLDKTAAEATGSDDSAEVVERITRLQAQVERAYAAMEKAKSELNTLSVPAEG